MHATRSIPAQRTALTLVASVLVLSSPLAAQGATGTSATSSRAVGTATPFTAADVAFMQGMIGHHAQALVMSALVPTRTTTPALRLLAERIAVAQGDEIAIMQQWLRERQQTVPTGHEGHDAHAGHAMGSTHATAMPGMLTPAQLDSLGAATGVAFDRLFLRYMIQHHEGALVMVDALLKTPGAAQDPIVYQFAADVDAEQRAEIRRMKALLTP